MGAATTASTPASGAHSATAAYARRACQSTCGSSIRDRSRVYDYVMMRLRNELDEPDTFGDLLQRDVLNRSDLYSNHSAKSSRA